MQIKLPTYFRPSGIPEDPFSGLVGNFFPKPMLTCQIDGMHPPLLGQILSGGLTSLVKIPALDVLRGLNLGNEHRFHIDGIDCKNLAWIAEELPGKGHFCRGHTRTPKDKEHFTAKALRTPREDGRRKRGEGSKRKDSHFCSFEKVRKSKNTPLLRERWAWLGS